VSDICWYAFASVFRFYNVLGIIERVSVRRRLSYRITYLPATHVSELSDATTGHNVTRTHTHTHTHNFIYVALPVHNRFCYIAHCGFARSLCHACALSMKFSHNEGVCPAVSTSRCSIGIAAAIWRITLSILSTSTAGKYEHVGPMRKNMSNRSALCLRASIRSTHQTGHRSVQPF